MNQVTEPMMNHKSEVFLFSFLTIVRVIPIKLIKKRSELPIPIWDIAELREAGFCSATVVYTFGHIVVIATCFSVAKARNQLLTKGVVYSFRTHKRKRLGNDWVNSGRGKPKLADVFIHLVGEVDLSLSYLALNEYVVKSGFESATEWFEEILGLNPKGGLKGWIYKVELRK